MRSSLNLNFNVMVDQRVQSAKATKVHDAPETFHLEMIKKARLQHKRLIRVKNQVWLLKAETDS